MNSFLALSSRKSISSLSLSCSNTAILLIVCGWANLFTSGFLLCSISRWSPSLWFWRSNAPFSKGFHNAAGLGSLSAPRKPGANIRVLSITLACKKGSAERRNSFLNICSLSDISVFINMSVASLLSSLIFNNGFSSKRLSLLTASSRPFLTGERDLDLDLDFINISLSLNRSRLLSSRDWNLWRSSIDNLLSLQVAINKSFSVVIFGGSYTSDHFIWNLLNKPLASLMNFIWNDHKCKILFIIWPFKPQICS